jgi:predicted DNA-binding WGR domain protein
MTGTWQAESKLREATEQGRRWRFRLENTTNRSAFWEIEYTPGGKMRVAAIRWGRLGTAGQSKQLEVNAALDRARQKLSQRGYEVVGVEIDGASTMVALSAPAPGRAERPAKRKPKHRIETLLRQAGERGLLEPGQVEIIEHAMAKAVVTGEFDGEAFGLVMVIKHLLQWAA